MVVDKNVNVNTPLHVAVIMDGNGRWATSRGLQRLIGHRHGVDRVRDVVRVCPDYGVKYLTLFAFSTENWKRSEEEVVGLMRLFKRYIQAEATKLMADRVRVRFIGDRSRLDKDLRDLMLALENQTAENDHLHMTVAINYGGRDELKRATQKIARQVQAGTLDPADIDEVTISQNLDTSFLPDPDLVIRTSGEYRTSNFLPWQSTYSEYAFVKEEWPDFTPAIFARVLEDMAGRERRFGRVAAQ